MWITFKSCIFAFWNNSRIIPLSSIAVVNYIQILYLCILKQQTVISGSIKRGCELHSNLVSLHSETTNSSRLRNELKLWITFKSCIFAFWNNNFALSKLSTIVVNYIQILYLCILKQLSGVRLTCLQVVNYIQILYLCILKQHCILKFRLLLRCELHSNLVSLHSETTALQSYIKAHCCELHSNLVSLHSETTIKISTLRQGCCELHSNLVSLHSETTSTKI